MLLNVLDFEVGAGLTADAEAILVQKVETARSIAEPADWLNRIALAREGMGRREDAVATYREALEATDAIPSTSTRTNVLSELLGRRLSPVRLIAETAPQAARWRFRLMPDGESDVKPDTVPGRCRTRFRREAGRHSELKPDTHR
jgi:hypothetical protein